MKAVGRHPWEIQECPHSRASSLVEYVHSWATDSSYFFLTGQCIATRECGFHWLPTVPTKWSNIGPQACGELEWMACSQARAMWTDVVTTSWHQWLINLTRLAFYRLKLRHAFTYLVESGRTPAPAKCCCSLRALFPPRFTRNAQKGGERRCFQDFQRTYKDPVRHSPRKPYEQDMCRMLHGGSLLYKNSTWGCNHEYF